MNQSKPYSIGTEVKPNANESAKCKCCNYMSDNVNKVKNIIKFIIINFPHQPT